MNLFPSRPKTTVRPALRRRDFAAVLRRRGRPVADAREIRERFARAGAEMWLAYDGRTLVGWLVAWRTLEGSEFAPGLWVDTLWVDPDFWDRGHEASLLACVLGRGPVTVDGRIPLPDGQAAGFGLRSETRPVWFG